MARRAVEIGCAIATHQAQGGSVIFQTLTMRHHKGQALGTLWDALSFAWNAVARGKVFTKRRDALGIRGFLRAVEVTHGPNGWHVHIHALWFVRGGLLPHEVDDFAEWVIGKWSRALVRRDLAAPLPAGQLARLVTGPADADLSAYLTKATDLGLELTQSQSKRARKAHSTRPVWDLLTDVEQLGDADALDTWHEWERGSKGRRQMTWSHGLRDDLEVGVDKTDEEVAAEVEGDVDVLFITADGWDSVVARPHLMPQILDAAEVSVAELRSFLVRHQIEYVMPGGQS